LGNCRGPKRPHVDRTSGAAQASKRRGHFARKPRLEGPRAALIETLGGGCDLKLREHMKIEAFKAAAGRPSAKTFVLHHPPINRKAWCCPFSTSARRRDGVTADSNNWALRRMLILRPQTPVRRGIRWGGGEKTRIVRRHDPKRTGEDRLKIATRRWLVRVRALKIFFFFSGAIAAGSRSRYSCVRKGAFSARREAQFAADSRSLRERCRACC